MPEVMGRGQAFFPDDPGYTMPGYNDLWSFHRDYHQTPGPAAHDPTPPNVRTSPSSLHKKGGPYSISERRIPQLIPRFLAVSLQVT